MKNEKQIISGIYRITNLANKRFYYGSTVDFNKRRNHHFNLLSQNKHKNQFLQNDFNNHKLEDYIFDIIEYVCYDVDTKILLKVEQKYLDLHWDNKKQCYNICQIAGPGPVMSGEDNPFFGKTHTVEAKKIIGEKSKLKIISEELKQENSLRTTGIGNPNYGKKHSEDTLNKMKETKKKSNNQEEVSKKISETMKLVWKNKDYTKKVVQLSLEEKVIRIYESPTDASVKTGFPRVGITSCIKRNRRTSFGFIWRYENE